MQHRARQEVDGQYNFGDRRSKALLPRTIKSTLLPRELEGDGFHALLLRAGESAHPNLRDRGHRLLQCAQQLLETVAANAGGTLSACRLARGLGG